MGAKTLDFLITQFDKLLLCGLFVFSCFFTLHVMHHMGDQELVLWGRETGGTILGAMLGLITGHALASKSTATIPGAVVTTETKNP